MTVRSLRIAHVVENLNRGGLERVVIDLVRTQKRRGHHCKVICLFERGLLAEELEADGIEVMSCGKRSGLDLRALARLRAEVRAHEAEVMHTHNATAHYYAVLATLGMPLRRINTRHGMSVTHSSSRREQLYRLALRKTDAVVAVCEAGRHALAQSGIAPAGGIVAIRNGIAIERFEPADAVSRARLVAEWGWPAGTRVIGTIGRLNPAKNQLELMRAFAELRRSLPDTALVIAGDGELRGELTAESAAAIYAGRVRLLGDRSDVASLLRGFDVFALSSVTEGYSVALLEACAAALPIVATDVGGNNEIVRDDVNGRLVRPVAGELAHALSDLLNDRVHAQGMGQAGREWVRREGSLETMAERYEALYTNSSAAAAA